MEEFYKEFPGSERIGIGIAIISKTSNIFVPKYTISKNEKSIKKGYKSIYRRKKDKPL